MENRDEILSLDFEPAEIANINRAGGEITIHLPSQPCYSERTANSVPLYRCSIHVHNGEVKRSVALYPYVAESIYIEYKRGARGSFLPMDFREDGPVSLHFLDRNDEAAIVISGDSVELKAFRTGRSEQLVPSDTYKSLHPPPDASVTALAFATAAPVAGACEVKR